MPIRKPGLVINIPGGSAAAEPQLPYSQRPQPNMGFRGPQVRHPLQQNFWNCRARLIPYYAYFISLLVMAAACGIRQVFQHGL
jgi:hypothetical protein